LQVSYRTTTPFVCQILNLGSGNFSVQYLGQQTLPTISTCTVLADQIGDARYYAAPTVTQSFTYAKAESKISVKLSTPVTATGAYVYATVTKATGGNVRTVKIGVSTTTPEICSLSDVIQTFNANEGTRATVRAIKNGICSLNLNFLGDGTLLPVDTVWQTTISGVVEVPTGSNTPQTITFPSIADREYGPAASLKAVTSSGLPITYQSLTPSVCTLIYTTDGSFIQSLKNTTNADSITCTVQASQPGDNRYAAATPVQVSFNWLKAAMKITVAPQSFTGKSVQTVDAAVAFVDSTKMGGMQSLGHPLKVSSADLSICTVNSTQPYSAPFGAGIYSRSRITTYKNGTCTLNFVFEGTDTRKSTFLVWSANVSGR
jgi:hypothetical protein